MKRSRIEIIFEILKALDSGVTTKTRLMYASNLDWRNFSRYVDYMLKEGLIATKGNEYRLTEKGRSLLVKLREISQILSLRQV
ncbi:MAG: winged helix-turn-helix domain-containing protein [Archaeoglobaceae archaeon]